MTDSRIIYYIWRHCCTHSVLLWNIAQSSPIFSLYFARLIPGLICTLLGVFFKIFDPQLFTSQAISCDTTKAKNPNNWLEYLLFDNISKGCNATLYCSEHTDHRIHSCQSASQKCASKSLPKLALHTNISHDSLLGFVLNTPNTVSNSAESVLNWQQKPVRLLFHIHIYIISFQLTSSVDKIHI